ncbi:MAG: WhiB family transcriptional regulator [Acidimicrobiales bacterium]
MAHASCRGSHPRAFFSLTAEGDRQACAICARCTVREECLAFALRHGLHDGVWGGLSERERRAVRLGPGPRP